MDDYKRISKVIRRSIIQMNAKSYASHSGSALSIVDLLTVLYFKILKIDPKTPDAKGRDRFILSKGHASSALYATLAERGFFDKSLLEGFYVDDGVLPGHLDKTAAPGIEVSSGSLGHGLPLGMGMALADRLDGYNEAKVVVLCGDGELNEGSVWEACMLAPHLNLTNLVMIIDYNKLQGYGKTNQVINLEPLKDKFEAFNWFVSEIDGHNYESIENVFTLNVNKPHVIIAHTIKGKGVSYMEDQFIWHYKSPNAEELAKALGELE